MHQPQSLLAVVDFTGMKITRERTKKIKDMAAHNRPHIRFIALVGLGFFRSMMLSAMLRLSGSSNHRVFRTRERALDWLAEK